MADSDTEYEHRESTSVGFPQSQELFSDPEYDTERNIASSAHETDESLFQAKAICKPTRSKRIRGGVKPNAQPALNSTSSDSSDYTLPPKKLTVKEIVQNHFRKKKRGKHKSGPSGKRKKQVNKRKAKSIIFLKQRRKRTWLHRGIRFPFTSWKYLPFSLYFPYEQFVFGGFLNYIKNLKFERHLQNSLKNMVLNKELDNRDIEMRKYSYLDDDGPISPISESGKTTPLFWKVKCPRRKIGK
ncbi:TATA box-binding protein-associated factor RNA polymerase I subunit D isoform X2 [Pseudophryne corroboree]|uniref:TATA box-binding protein-associated factor RNA polymerase I subunit D isoform X2 n=1 Tax=Pseudophryne corroboree TaxID=495146 RepID=UPI0030821004